MIGRIIIDGPPIHHHVEGREMEGVARDLLSCAFESWPTDQQARFVITPSGFLKSDLPSGLSKRSGWDSVAGDFALLQRAAEAVVRRVVSPRVLKLAKGKVASLTIGIDLGEFDGQTAELVAFLDMADGKILRWTGKSYPTAAQERTLIQVLDLESHCLRFEGERVLILGCHDLNMFSPRGWNNQVPGGHRRERCRAVRSIVSEFRPTVVLHHPHTTDSPRIWMQSWAFLPNDVEFNSCLNDWASGICFYRCEGERGTLRKVAAATRCPRSSRLDLVFHTSDGGTVVPKWLE